MTSIILGMACIFLVHLSTKQQKEYLELYEATKSDNKKVQAMIDRYEDKISELRSRLLRALENEKESETDDRTVERILERLEEERRKEGDHMGNHCCGCGYEAFTEAIKIVKEEMGG